MKNTARTLAALMVAISIILLGGAHAAKKQPKATKSMPLSARIEREVGQNVWVWMPDYCPCDKGCKLGTWKKWPIKKKIGHYHHLAAMMRSAGVVSVNVKYHDGSIKFDHFSQNFVNVLRAHGLRVYLWGYNRANAKKYPQEARLIIAALDNPKTSGYIFNTERGVEGDRTWCTKMVAIVAAHHATCPRCRHKLLGYAPYALPSRHRALPHDVFGAVANFVMPQMYWRAWGHSVDDAVILSYRDWSAWNQEMVRTGKMHAIADLVPLGQAYGPATPQEMRRFLYDTGGYYAVSWWDLAHLTKARREALREAHKIRLKWLRDHNRKGRR